MVSVQCAVSATINVRLPGRPSAAMRRPRPRDELVPGAPGRPPPCRLHRRPPSANVMLSKKNANVNKKTIANFETNARPGPPAPRAGRGVKGGWVGRGPLNAAAALERNISPTPTRP